MKFKQSLKGYDPALDIRNNCPELCCYTIRLTPEGSENGYLISFSATKIYMDKNIKEISDFSNIPLKQENLKILSTHVSSVVVNLAKKLNTPISIDYDIPDLTRPFNRERSGFPPFKDKPSCVTSKNFMHNKYSSPKEDRVELHSLTNTTRNFLANTILYENKIERVLAQAQNRTPELIPFKK